MTKLIKLEGTNNTRDLGGYTNIHGQTIRNNMIFRSDKLSELTESDLEEIKLLGIKTIVDFRSENEKKDEPNNIPDEINYIEMPIAADKDIRLELNDVINGKSNKKMGQFLIDVNKDFVLLYSDIFSEFLKRLISNPEPTLFHCTSGKDRTGFAAFLILHILEIPKNIILEDYLKTNDFIKDSLEHQINHVSKLLNIPLDKASLIKPLLLVDIEYINNAINTINQYYGSIDNYISDVLHITNIMKIQLRKIMMI
jgi:protein-tyrosine phosphatase